MRKTRVYKFDTMTEGGAEILARLVEAAETNRADRTRVFPKGFGSSMPDYIHDEKEWWAMLVDDAVNGDDKAWERIKADRNRQGSRFAKLSSERVSRAEECETWWRLIEDADLRAMLGLYVGAKLADRPWAAVVAARNKKKHSSKAWIVRKSYRQIHVVLEYLFQKVLKQEIFLMPDPDCVLEQISPELTSRSSNSKICAWSDEKWMPVVQTADEQPDKR